MQTYEINLWKDKKIVEKVVKQFESDEQVMEYIKNNFDRQPEPQYPQLDPLRGYVRPKADDHIITWSKISTYVRKTAPKRLQLTEQEKQLMSGARVKCLDRLENIMDLIKMLKVIANGQAEKIGLIIKNKGIGKVL